MFGSFYFLSENMLIHTREAVTIVGVLAEVGGLFDVILIVFGFFVIPFNEFQLQTKAVKNMYFKVKESDRGHKAKDRQVEVLRFKFIDRVMVWVKSLKCGRKMTQE